MVDLLLSGGVGTTASLTSNTVVWLYQHPEVRQRLEGRPVAAGQGDRGVPAVLLPHAGAGADGRPGHRAPGLPDEEGRPRAARLVVGQPRPRAVREPRRGRHHAVAEPARGLRPGRAPLRRLPPRPRDGQGDAHPDPDADGRLRRRRVGPEAVPAAGHEQRLDEHPGHVHARPAHPAGLGGPRSHPVLLDDGALRRRRPRHRRGRAVRGAGRAPTRAPGSGCSRRATWSAARRRWPARSPGSRTTSTPRRPACRTPARTRWPTWPRCRTG